MKNASVAALYGIEQSNRGCDFGVIWNPGQCVPRARSLDGIVLDKPCNAGDASGCGAGIVTGKIQPDDGPYPQSLGNRAVNAGGIPLYRVISARLGEGIVDEAGLVGGIGVVGIAGDSQLAEFAAALTAVGAAGMACEFHAELEPGKDGVHLLVTLVNVSPADPMSLVGASGVLIVSALLGCLIPARRATKVDPLVALHCE